MAKTTTTQPITLKGLKVLERASDESLCFEATVLWRGRPVALATDDGKGGETNVQPLGGKANSVLDELEAWVAANVPPYRYMEVDGAWGVVEVTDPAELAHFRAVRQARDEAYAAAGGWRAMVEQAKTPQSAEVTARLVAADEANKAYTALPVSFVTLESYIAQLAEQEHNDKRHRRACATKTVFILDGKKGEVWEVNRPFCTAARDQVLAEKAGHTVEFVNLRYGTLAEYDAKAGALENAADDKRHSRACASGKTLFIRPSEPDKVYTLPMPFSTFTRDLLTAKYAGESLEFLNLRYGTQAQWDAKAEAILRGECQHSTIFRYQGQQYTIPQPFTASVKAHIEKKYPGAEILNETYAAPVAA